MNQDKLYQLSREVVSPVLISYVSWVLNKAQQYGISTLYFQARDGYSLIKIAQKLCHQHQYQIECRYLYCSRAALRMPTYHLIGEEAYDLLFLPGPHVTLESFFRRAGIPNDLQETIIEEMGINRKELTKVLHANEIAVYKEQFRLNTNYCNFVTKASKAAYNDTIAYLKQELLFEQPCIGIVDSGWVGSMQRSLRQLLSSAGYHGKIIGFYFGMFAMPKSPQDGEYHTWYFSQNHHIWNKACFNSHLFECMLSAPHGMTLSYKKENDIYVPVQAPSPSGKMLECIERQLRGFLDGVEDYITDGLSESANDIKARFRRLMIHPSRDEAEAYRNFLFCHDITDENQDPLVTKEQLSDIRKYTLIARILRKLARKEVHHSVEPYWIYGTLAYIEPTLYREWLRANIWIYEFLRYLFRRN